MAADTMNVVEAAIALGIKPDTLYRRLRDPREVQALGAVKVDGQWRIPASAVQQKEAK